MLLYSMRHADAIAAGAALFATLDATLDAV